MVKLNKIYFVYYLRQTKNSIPLDHSQPQPPPYGWNSENSENNLSEKF